MDDDHWTVEELQAFKEFVEDVMANYAELLITVASDHYGDKPITLTELIKLTSDIQRSLDIYETTLH